MRPSPKDHWFVIAGNYSYKIGGTSKQREVSLKSGIKLKAGPILNNSEKIQKKLGVLKTLVISSWGGIRVVKGKKIKWKESSIK